MMPLPGPGDLLGDGPLPSINPTSGATGGTAAGSTTTGRFSVTGGGGVPARYGPWLLVLLIVGGWLWLNRR